MDTYSEISGMGSSVTTNHLCLTLNAHKRRWRIWCSNTPSLLSLIMNYRDFHPGDIALVYGNVKQIERVDKTHVATRAANDNLELWAYSEELRPITYSDRLYLKDLGFAYQDDYYIFDADGYTVYWKPINCIVEDREGSPHRKRCKTLGDVQQFFYQISGFELPL